MNRVNDPLTAWVLEDPSSRAPLALGVLGAMLVLPLVLFAVYFYRMGSRAIAARRFPPEGYRMLRAAEPITGDAAVRQGRVVRGLALVLAAGVIAIIVVLGRTAVLLSRLQA